MKLRTATITLAATLLSVGAAGAAERSSQADLTEQFVQQGVTIERLRVVEVGGIVVIRGRTMDRLHAEEAGRTAQRLGYTRVANLVQISEPVDDRAIERRAERALTHRSLDGCDLRIDSEGGVVRVAGRVQHELQKDVAHQLVRNLEGVRSVRLELYRVR